MKLHNLTDVSTPTLASLGLVGASIKVGGKTIPPGGSESFKFAPAEASRHIRVGALFAGENPPAKYLAAKPKPAALVVEAVPRSLPPPEVANTEPAPEAPFDLPPSRRRRHNPEE